MRATALLLIFLSVFGALSPMFPITARAQSQSWSSPATVPSGSLIHYSPSVAQDQQNNTWVFWSQGPGIFYNINYTRCQPVCWSADQRFPSDNGLGTTPQAETLNNGTMMVFWAAKRPGTTTSSIYYSSCTQCTVSNPKWTPGVLLTTDASDNTKPSSVQDQTGKIWTIWSRAESSDLKIKFVDSNSTGHWVPGDAIVYDTNSNGVYDAGDLMIYGTAPSQGSRLLIDPRIRFVDPDHNRVWEPGEAVVYDSDLNGVFDPKLKFVDSNGNNVWDPGESVIYDSNASGAYVSGDPILAGITPAPGTVLKSDLKVKFVDSDGNGVWDPGEMVIYDSNGNNRYDPGEPIISAPLTSDSKIMFAPSPSTSNTWYANETIVYDNNGNGVYDGKIKFVDTVGDGVWHSNETVVYDSNLDSIFNSGDQVIFGTPPVLGTPLRNDPRLKFIESDGKPGWDRGEAVVYDTNRNNLLDLGEPIIAGVDPANGTLLKIDKRIRFVDTVGDGVWHHGNNTAPPETVVYDKNNDTIYESSEPVIVGEIPLNGTILRSDPKLKFVDLNGNGVWDPGEPVVYDTNNDGLHETYEPVVRGANPAIGSALNVNTGEQVIYSQIAGSIPDPGTLLKSDPKIQFFDSDGTGIWKTGKFVAYDSNANKLYDSGDTPITGTPPRPAANAPLTTDELVIVNASAPPIGTVLSTDSLIRYVDSNANGHWDPGEPVAIDSNGNGLFDAGDRLIAGPTPAAGTPYSPQDPKIKYVDTDKNLKWGAGELVIYDSNNNNVYDTGDIIIANTPSSTPLKLDYNLFYKTFNAGSWSQDQRLTTSPKDDTSPSVTQTRDGKVRAFFSRSGSLFYKTFDGTTWSSEAQLITHPTGVNDTNPTSVQDRNGTIWLVWTRVLPPVPPNVPTYLYYATSTDNGATWSQAQAMTSGGNEFNPSIAQLNDKKLWVFYSSATPTTVNLNYINTLVSTHDARMNNFTVAPPRVRVGELVSLNTTVSNVGDFPETYQLTVKANSTVVATNSGSLALSQSKLISINWDTSSMNAGVYVLTANLTLAPMESLGNRGDDVLTFTIHIVPRGDVNRDCVVNILDLALVGSSFGKRLGNPGYNPDADLNHDGVIDIVDLAIVGSSFGQQGGC